MCHDFISPSSEGGQFISIPTKALVSPKNFKERLGIGFMEAVLIFPKSF